MTVGADKLIRMAEQIAANISISDDDDVVAERVAEHLQKFWDPHMRAAILEYAEAHPASIKPQLRRALDKLPAVNPER